MGVLMRTVALCAPISSFMKFHQCCGAPPGAGQTDVIMHHCTRCGVCEQHACTRVHGERQSLHVLPL